MQVREPAVAGSFYPREPAQVAALVDACMASAPEVVPTGTAPKALIVPHAGFVYSGPIAATAYAQLAPVRSTIERVVLIGPSHRVPFRGLAASGASSFLTPLGAVPVDLDAVSKALALPQVRVLEEAHATEHSLEVQLPFLQRVLDDFALVPLVAGDASAVDVAEVIDALWGGPETLIVISSDLSHYSDYATARALDEQTTRAIERLEPEALDFESACGRVGVRGLLVVARRRGLRVRTLDLRSSGDTAGDRARVVGYGAYAFS